MRDAFVARLLERATADPRIMLITADLGFGVLTRFAEALPRQYLNVGVAEQNLAAVATGMALEGHVVFTYSIGNFPTLRCLEQLRNDACYHGAAVKSVAIGGGFSYGPLGFSHFATEDLAILRALPGMTVVAPGDLWEAEESVDALIAAPGPAYLRLDKSSAGRTNAAGEGFALGRSRRVRDGGDVTLVACGGILGDAVAAADALAGEGLRCRVLSMHTLTPVDGAGLAAACAETGGLVTIEEHVVSGGLGGAVAEHCLEHGLRPRAFARLGLRGEFATTVGGQAYLRDVYGMGRTAIMAAARDVAARK